MRDNDGGYVVVIRAEFATNDPSRDSLGDTLFTSTISFSTHN